MERSETIIGNCVICEYANGESRKQRSFFIPIPGKELKHWVNDRDLKYHVSWDWLMPVAFKIVNEDTGTLDVYRLYVADAASTFDIKRLWDACIDFIEWFNNKNKKHEIS